MTNILLLKSSARGADSHSTRLAEILVHRLQSAHPDAELVERDLAAYPPPHLGAAYIAGRYLDPAARTPDQAAALVSPDRSIAELKAADYLIIASAMVNFSISAQLKAWIDEVVRTNATFGFENGLPVGLLTGKKAFVIEARGGIYDDPPMNQMDFQQPYLQAVLGFIGITDLTFIKCQGTSMGDDIAANAIAGAEAAIASAIPL